MPEKPDDDKIKCGDLQLKPCVLLQKITGISAGNSLSDLARHRPELVYKLVKQLIAIKDINTKWSATRACRNLVKTDTVRVMDVLGTDEYRYKDRSYSRKGKGK